MKLWIGLAAFIVGGIAAGVVFVFNSQTPMQLGPIPFFGAAAISLAGLIAFISAL